MSGIGIVFTGRGPGQIPTRYVVSKGTTGAEWRRLAENHERAKAEALARPRPLIPAHSNAPAPGEYTASVPGTNETLSLSLFDSPTRRGGYGALDDQNRHVISLRVSTSAKVPHRDLPQSYAQLYRALDTWAYKWGLYGVRKRGAANADFRLLGVSHMATGWTLRVAHPRGGRHSFHLFPTGTSPDSPRALRFVGPPV